MKRYSSRKTKICSDDKSAKEPDSSDDDIEYLEQTLDQMLALMKNIDLKLADLMEFLQKHPSSLQEEKTIQIKTRKNHKELVPR